MTSLYDFIVGMDGSDGIAAGWTEAEA